MSLRPWKGALERDPENAALAVHLAEVLLDAGRPGDALRHCRAVLAHDPSHAGALDVAARALEGEPAGVPPITPEPEPPAPQAEPATVVPLRVVDGGAGGDDDAYVERPTVTLADVGGMRRSRSASTPRSSPRCATPSCAALYGKSLRGGLLLYGPPGCGKTFIARAVAGELGAALHSRVGLTDVLDMWLGETERKLHELFETARRHAPCVLFLDEVDALGQKRSHLRHSGGRNVVNQLLAELDGVDGRQRGRVRARRHQPPVGRRHRAAPPRPARPHAARPAARRSPRARRSCASTCATARSQDIDLAQARAHGTEGYSGADLAHLCETAAERAMQRVDRDRRDAPDHRQQRPRARRARDPAVDRRAWFGIAHNDAMYANERRPVRRPAGLYPDAQTVVSGGSGAARARAARARRRGEALEQLREADRLRPGGPGAAQPDRARASCQLERPEGRARGRGDRRAARPRTEEWPHRLRASRCASSAARAKQASPRRWRPRGSRRRSPRCTRCSPTALLAARR